MKSVKISKALVCYPVMLACAGFVAGCHSTKTHHASTYSSYPTYPAAGAPATSVSESTSGSATSSQRMTESAQGQINIPTYEEQVIVGTRTVESGGVRLRKEIVTETVNQPVQVRRETIVVDREAAASGQATQGAITNSGSLGTPFQGGELVIRLHNEEPVVETRVVPSGRVVVQTRTNAEQQTVQRQVRKEKIDVEKLGNSENVIISEKPGGETKEAVGAPAPESQQIQGQGTKQDQNRKVQDTEEPFPRPQPDGRLTFPELYKGSQKP